MKSLIKNSIYNIIYRGINVLYPLITTAYISRVIMAGGVGKIAAAQNIVQYFTILAALGIPTYGIKVIAQAKNDRDEKNIIFSELFLLNFMSTSICLISYYVLVFITEGFDKGILLYSIVGVSIFLNYFNVDWFYQGEEEYKYILFRNILVKIISLIMIFTFIKKSEDYVLYAVILVFGTGLNNLFNIIHIKKYVKLVFKNLNLKRHIASIMALFSATIAIEIYTLADTTMLTYMCGDKIVGYYSNAVKSISAIKTMMVSICAVFLPRLSLYIISGEKKKFDELVTKGLKIILFLTIPATVGMIMVSKFLVPFLFGAEFIPSVLTTQILSISIITVSLSNFIGYQVLVSMGREKTILISTIIGAITNVILNICLIKYMQQNGAAVASVITETMVTLIQLADLIKYIKIDINKKYIRSIMFSTLCMGVGLIFINSIISAINTVLLKLCINVIVGLIIYFGVNLILKNEIINIVKDKMRR